MSILVYIWLTGSLIGVNLIYFRTARYFGLLDKPNERSSHTDFSTIRSGGILFYLAALAASLVNNVNLSDFFAGLTMVALISFWDDLFAVLIRYRIGVQTVAIGLLVRQLEIFPNQEWLFIGLMISCVGLLNAYNFMDGINGMTAFYSLVTIGTLWYLKASVPGATDPLLPFIFISLLVFSYFNARRQAVCFAGDVGSISIGFISLYALLEAIDQRHTYLLVLLLAVYGVDSILTIVHRIYRRQNIVQAHRMHLFQLLVHQLGWPHLRVSALYALVQLGINGLVLLATGWPLTAQLLVSGAILNSLSTLYFVAVRRLVQS